MFQQRLRRWRGRCQRSTCSSKMRHVAGLAQVGVDAGDQPQRVVVEAAADVHVALFGQRLVLVVGAAVRELCGGDVQNTLAGAVRDEVHKAQQVLAGLSRKPMPRPVPLS